MPLVNPDPLKYPGAASTAGGTSTSSGASTDEATQWIQQQPWYRETLAKWGNPKTLTLGQRGYLARTAQQAGLNKDFGINTDGTVEDWSTPTGAKIALAAMAAWAGGVGLGVLPNGSAAAAPTLEASMNAGMNATTSGIPSEFGQTAVDTLTSAAPSTGSKLPDWLKLAEDVGGSLGAASAGRAQGRNLDNIANIGFAQAQNDLYNSELRAPQQIASNSVRGDILSNAKDVSIAAPSNIPVPQISGGLRPSMFSDSTRQLGKTITANAAATPMPVATPPVLQPMETAGTTDDILNTAGYLSSLAKPGYDIWKMFNA